MNCRGVLDVLSEYLEGEAGSTICKKIEEHLRGCERCRMHIDNMRKIIILQEMETRIHPRRRADEVEGCACQGVRAQRFRLEPGPEVRTCFSRIRGEKDKEDAGCPRQA